MKGLINLLVLVIIGFGFYGLFKPLPTGVSDEHPTYKVAAEGIHFYEDLTYVDASAERKSDQEIFDQVFKMIDGANHYILVDMFLFNDLLGASTEGYRALSGELTEALIAKKEKNQDISVVLITDPINNIYGGVPSEQLQRLRDAGVVVVVTDLKQLRDSNPIYGAFYRTFIQWFDVRPTDKGYLANPFTSTGPKLGLRTYLELFNFKANHRKVVVADGWTSRGFKIRTLVTSANPHDGSSAHTNTALVIDDFIWRDVLESERAVAFFSAQTIPNPSTELLRKVSDEKGETFVQLLTEKKIKEKIVEEIRKLDKGESLDMAMFYLSDRQIVLELKAASKRGADIRVLLDPNKDAFGREKNGIPNRQVAHELSSQGDNTEIRWCDTNGEQCHSKMLLFKSKRTKKIILGSANLTRRNVGGFNLETNVFIESATEIEAITDAETYFEKVWSNQNGRIYSAPYEKYADDSLVKRIVYRFMEDLGLSTF